MKPTKRDKEILPHLTREIVARYSIRSLMNTAALVDAASALLDRGHYGAARSLAISAREECGKGFMAGAYLAGVIPEEEFAVGRRNHSYKQAEGLIVPTMLSALSNHPELLSLLIPTNAIPSLTSMKDAALKMEGNADEIQNTLSGTLEALRPLREAATTGDHEKMRQQGIYVSLEMNENGLTLEYPQEIGRADAEAELNPLITMITTLVPDVSGGIPSELWNDDTVVERWAVYCEKLFTPGMFGLSSLNSPSTEN